MLKIKKQIIKFFILFIFTNFSLSEEKFINALWYNVMYLNLDDESKTKQYINQHFELMSKMKINTVIFLTKDPQGYVYYQSKYAKSKCNWDVLGYIIEKAKQYKMEIHPYINVFAEEGYFLKENPQYTELRNNKIKTTWASPSLKPVRERILNIINEIISNYEIDGIQLDRIRYPAYKDVGFHPESIKLYKKIYKKEPNQNDLDFYQFKCDLISSFVEEISKFIKSKNKNIKFSAAVFHTPTTSKNNFIAQQWDLWVKNEYLDYVFTMTYTNNIKKFKNYLDENIKLFKSIDTKTKLVVGIGVYYEGMTEEILNQQINLCLSEKKVTGICYFNFYSLIENHRYIELVKNINF